MSGLTRDRLYHYAAGVGGKGGAAKAVCPSCGRTVRVRGDGRLFKHLATLATANTGGVQCPNRQRGND